MEGDRETESYWASDKPTQWQYWRPPSFGQNVSLIAVNKRNQTKSGSETEDKMKQGFVSRGTKGRENRSWAIEIFK